MPLGSIQNFLDTMDNHQGLATPDRFYVQFIAPTQLSFLNSQINDLTFLCHSAELPGIILNTNTYKTYGPGRQIPTLTIYNEITFSFFCTNNFFEKAFFDGWIKFINPSNQNWDFRYIDEVTTNINITKLSATSDEPIFTMQLIKAFPVAVYPMGLSWERTNSYLSLPVTFNYQSYDILDNLTYSSMTTSSQAQLIPSSGGNSLSDFSQLTVL